MLDGFSMLKRAKRYEPYMLRLSVIYTYLIEFYMTYTHRSFKGEVLDLRSSISGTSWDVNTHQLISTQKHFTVTNHGGHKNLMQIDGNFNYNIERHIFIFKAFTSISHDAPKSSQNGLEHFRLPSAFEHEYVYLLNEETHLVVRSHLLKKFQ